MTVAVHWRKACHWMFASLKTAFAIVQIVLKECVTSSHMFNRLCTTHTPNYQNLAIQCVHSLRTNKNKKTTEIQCFISGFSSHILTMLQWYCFRHCQQIFAFLFKATKCYACVYFCVFTFVEGLRTSSVPSESLSWKAKAKENKTMRTCAHT